MGGGEQEDKSPEEVLDSIKKELFSPRAVEVQFKKKKAQYMYYKLYVEAGKTNGCTRRAKEVVVGSTYTDADANYWLPKLQAYGGFKYIQFGRGKDNEVRIYKPSTFNKKAIAFIEERRKEEENA